MYIAQPDPAPISKGCDSNNGRIMAVLFRTANRTLLLLARPVSLPLLVQIEQVTPLWKALLKENILSH